MEIQGLHIKSNQLYSQKADIETSSEEYAKRFSGEIGKYFLDLQEKYTFYFLNKKNYKTILDVGGGHAQLAVPLVKNNFNVTIFGSDQTCALRLKKFLKPGTYKVDTGNLLKLPYSDKSFDAVTCFRLLTHEEHWKEQIAELCRIARYEVIIDYPDIRSFNLLYKYFFKTKKKFEGNTRCYRNFNRKELINEFLKNGFDLPQMKPEFFLPMVIHRKVNNLFFSKISEKICDILRLTRFFGSPVILSVTRRHYNSNQAV